MSRGVEKVTFSPHPRWTLYALFRGNTPEMDQAREKVLFTHAASPRAIKKTFFTRPVRKIPLNSHKWSIMLAEKRGQAIMLKASGAVKSTSKG